MISVAVAFTIPSVGKSFVGCKKCSNSVCFSFGALPGAERSTAQFLVAIRLVTVRTGLTPTGNSAAMIPSASVLLSTIFALPPSASNELESVFWKGVRLMSAVGTHMRVAPEDFRTSTCVVTSNVRQLLDAMLCPNRRPVLEKARPADTAAADRTKSRRFIDPPSRSKYLR